MGTGEKKKRREINAFLNKFLLKDTEHEYTFRENPAAREMIAEYAEPLDGLFETVSTRYSIAVFAWNLSLAPEDRRHELMEDFLSPLVQDNEEGRTALTDLIESLVDRRETLYPRETLLILPDENAPDEEPDYETEDTGPEDEESENL